MANQPTKYRKFVVGAASAALVASAVAPVASAATFSDVSDTNSHKASIDALVAKGVITGYPDGTFKPTQTLKRSDVVKMMGKWLVNTQGYKVPGDYKTNPRFTDLTSASNDELLQYAAVVKDNGVFVGTPDGKLDPNGNITRENMAIVLVRAFDRVHDIDLATYVAGQDFKKDVNDRSSAKAEARPAIDVLDYFDITNPAAPAFNPKGTTNRAQFASFLNKAIETDYSEVATGVVAPGVAAVKAVNATTVEVTFKDAVENVNSLNFTIDGLTVSNAAVKQSDNKTVVLTTAVQEGGKKYTVAVDGKEIGTFEGVSAVIPTKIDITTKSVQGKVGQQAIVSADVGVKQAGIPVTFNVDSQGTSLNKDQVFESVTNADGIATFSYTQYASGTDTVVAYPTGAPSVRSLGYVFWGVDTIINIEEVTTGDTINNGANKTYKVTYKNPTTGNPQSGVTLNVSALENINVTADKAQNVTVNGIEVAQFSNNTVTRAAQIVTDSKGEATFTVSGNHATVTPVVFAATPQYNAGGSLTGYSQAYTASALQARAPKVTFSALQAAYTLEMTREGGEVAAIGDTNGGREYKIVVKDKDGKLAANEIVNVAFNEDLDKVIATRTSAEFIDTSGDDQVFHTGAQAKKITVKTNSKGEATFVVGSSIINDYVTPIAWIDINTANASDAVLDNGEPTAVGPITHFQQEYVEGASLAAYKGTSKTTAFTGVETATFKTAVTNQSGLPYSAGSSIANVTYTVTNTGAEDVLVNDNGNWKIVSPNRSLSVSPNPVANLEVKPRTDSTTSVKVTATGNATYTDSVSNTQKTFAFTAKEATAKFTKVGEVPTSGYTAVITAYDTVNKTITFSGKNPVKYAGEAGRTYVFKGLGGVTIPDGATGFLAILAQNKVTASYTVVDDVVTFAIQAQDSSVGTATNPTVAASASAGTYNVGDTVGITLTFSENVTVTPGSTPPALTLSNGKTATHASTTGNTLVFNYTVAAGDNSASSLTVTGLTRNGATIVGQTTNAPANTSAFTSNLTGVVVSGVAPTATPNLTGGALKATGAQPNTVYLVSTDGTTWTEKTSSSTGELTLAPGTYSVKVKATPTNAESAAQTGLVVTLAPTATPQLVDGTGKLTGGVPNTVYLVSTDGTTWTDATANASGELTLAPGTYSVKVKATSTNAESAAQTGLTVS
ncbi:S-layer homology domain-containing protein [Sporosarcina sp. Marseille-Q4943]|uniref:S-layer homology domain-containing protein n=1 Tax=Sporosarcina sp. Marseille-Q4943 TaxID=2942204 RepID=UPI00208DBCCF|nr:S-layer homology domain-containing protein [Sporosarcina sp. Marseille-Q4943]